MPDLNCTKFEDRLAEAVEDRRSPVELSPESSDPEEALWRELRAHANACPECRKLWNEFALLERVLPAWKDCVPTVDLADAVIARWREEQTASRHSMAKPHADPPGRSNGHPGLAMLLAAAATALVCFLMFSLPRPGDEELPPTLPVSKVESRTVPAGQQSSDALAKQRSAVSSPEKSEADRDWEALAQEAGSACWVLASDTADSFASAAVFVPRPLSLLRRNPKRRKPTPKPTSQWVEGIEAGLKPVGQDVGQAMGFLLEVLPGGGSPL